MALSPAGSASPRELLTRLQQLRQEICAEGQAHFAQWQPLIRRRSFRGSALNLAHYLALRKRDIRPLQQALMAWGLSSLGRSEGRVLPNLDAGIATLGALCQVPEAELGPQDMRGFGPQALPTPRHCATDLSP